MRFRINVMCNAVSDGLHIRNLLFVLRRTFNVFILTCLPVMADVSVPKVNEKNAELEEVLVTGLKRGALPSKEYTGSLSIIDVNQLVSLNPDGFVEVAASVPGLHGQDTGARNPTPIIVRGINFDSMSSNDLGSDGTTVASYVDDIPLQGYYSPPQFLLKDLSKIEILRGPQGSLYGASSLAGLIRYETAKPNFDDLFVRLHSRTSQTSQSNGGNYDGDIIANLPIVDDVFVVRALISTTQNEGFIDNEYLVSGAQQDINDEQISATRIHMLYQPTESMTIGLMTHKQEAKVYDRQADNRSFAGEKYHASHRYIQPSDGSLATTSLNFHYELEKINIELIASDYVYEQQQVTDLTDLYQFYYLYSDVYNAFEESDVRAKQRSAEARITTRFDGAFSGLVGLFYSGNDLSVKLNENLVDEVAELQTVAFSATQDQNLEDKALFAELSWSASSVLELTLGGRYFNYKDSAEACSAFVSDSLNCYKETAKDSHSSFKLAGLFRANKDINVYGNISEGFRRGGANPGIPDELANRRNYAPDATVNYELGIKSLLWQERLRMDIGLFYISWSNVQLFSTEEVPSTDGFVNYITNVNDASTQGVEFELNAQLTPAVHLEFNYAYSDAKLSQEAPSYNDANGLGDNGNINDRLPGSPKTKVYLAAMFEKALKNTVFDVGINGSYVGGITTALNESHDNYDELGGYTLLNATVGLAKNKWRIGMFVNNIINKRSVTGKRGAFYYGEQGQFTYINRPRTYGLDISYQF